MSGPVETASALAVVLCLAIGTMFVLPKPKPEPPTEQQFPPEQLAPQEADSGTQPEGENAPLVPPTDEARIENIEQRLQEIQAKVSRIEKKASEPRRD